MVFVQSLQQRASQANLFQDDQLVVLCGLKVFILIFALLRNAVPHKHPALLVLLGDWTCY